MIPMDPLSGCQKPATRRFKLPWVCKGGTVKKNVAENFAGLVTKSNFLEK